MTSYSLLQIVLDCMFILKHYSDAGSDVNKAACFIACSHLLYMLIGFVIEVSTLSMEWNLLVQVPTLSTFPFLLWVCLLISTDSSVFTVFIFLTL